MVQVGGMSNEPDKILIRIGQSFEANASGKFAVIAVCIIVIGLFAIGHAFL